MTLRYLIGTEYATVRDAYADIARACGEPVTDRELTDRDPADLYFEAADMLLPSLLQLDALPNDEGWRVNVDLHSLQMGVQDKEITQVGDEPPHSEPAPDTPRTAVSVNDHGNPTLWAWNPTTSQWADVWAIV